MNIKEHIINNFKGDDYKALKEAIDESIESNPHLDLFKKHDIKVRVL